MQWIDILKAYHDSEPPLFDARFVERWGRTTWKPTADDRAAASKLHTELVSRVATRRLGYLQGDEEAALTSIAKLFQRTRDIADAHPDSPHFDALVWHVLNSHVRLFTAKWHVEAVRERLTALDATDEFRADLDALQPKLRLFDELLLYLRDGVAPPAQVEDSRARNQEIEQEMTRPIAWGIPPEPGRDEMNEQIAAINKAERESIGDRRKKYGLLRDPSGADAAGLAISGGGIRSATFSLGVLVALARRGLLPQFDYLSTVSGGGYLGCFLSAFLQSPDASVGLEKTQLPFRHEGGEAAALRHIRHHSRYLAVGSTWERLKMLFAQLLGMSLNTLALLWLILALVLIERSLRSLDLVSTSTAIRAGVFALVLGGLSSIVALRLGRKARVWADAFFAVPAAYLAGLFAWVALGSLQQWYKNLSPLSLQAINTKELWIAIAGAVPIFVPALEAIFPRLLRRLGLILAMLSAVAAPVFVLGVYLVLHDRLGSAGTDTAIEGMSLRLWTVVVGGLLVYVFVFDINATSPHRHYRRKLAQAYLIQPYAAPTRDDDNLAPAPHKDSAVQFHQDVPLKLSQLRSGKAPYPLINCALNVPASKDARMQGRLTDFFVFSPKYCGSPLIGYARTEEWEAVDSHLDLGTAMAISGAAAAPQMGLMTNRRFRFWLALLNVRLGYWARRPSTPRSKVLAPGLLHLVKEMLGSMDEKGPWINLSDGGHIENLGIYELLRRRCKYILAIDGEEDAKMTFRGMSTLQRLASIDLGVKIEIDLDDLRLNDKGLSRSHFRFCRIRYPSLSAGTQEDIGYLLYMKLSLTGNEGEFIRRYRLDEPTFPHHSTADQFFSEAQFEAYRTLGEHIGDKLFLRAIIGDLAATNRVDLDKWFQRFGTSLLEPRC